MSIQLPNMFEKLRPYQFHVGKNIYCIANEIVEEIFKCHINDRTRTTCLDGKDLDELKEFLTFEFGNFLISTQHFLSLAKNTESSRIMKSLRTRLDSAKASYNRTYRQLERMNASRELLDSFKLEQYCNTGGKTDQDVRTALLKIGSQVKYDTCFVYFGWHWCEIEVKSTRNIFESQRLVLMAKLRILAESLYGDGSALNPLLSDIYYWTGKCIEAQPESILSKYFDSGEGSQYGYDFLRTAAFHKQKGQASGKISKETVGLIKATMLKSYQIVSKKQLKFA